VLVAQLQMFLFREPSLQENSFLLRSVPQEMAMYPDVLFQELARIEDLGFGEPLLEDFLRRLQEVSILREEEIWIDCVPNCYHLNEAPQLSAQAKNAH
jgi:hypothetical protein